jgi:hypothetical protein
VYVCCFVCGDAICVKLAHCHGLLLIYATPTPNIYVGVDRDQTSYQSAWNSIGPGEQVRMKVNSPMTR